MDIRTIVATAATAAAALAVGLGAGPVSADETSDIVDVPAGGRACIELASSHPVRAEGVSDRGVRFTLTLDGAVVAVSAADEFGFQADSDAGSYGLYEGTARLCADNTGHEEAFVVLSLFSRQDGAGTAPVDPAPAPEPPAGEPTAGDQPPADGTRPSLEELVEDLVEQVEELVDALAADAAR